MAKKATKKPRARRAKAAPSTVVERLRAVTEKRYDWLATKREAEAIALMDEAADEIERLGNLVQSMVLASPATRVSTREEIPAVDAGSVPSDLRVRAAHERKRRIGWP